MSYILETINQQPSTLQLEGKGSETIPDGSTLEKVEAVSILPGKAEDEDIVQINTAFVNYLSKANQMFNNKFDYSKFRYKSAKIKGTIICPIHGEFEQNMDKHTAQNSHGCSKCWIDNKPYPSWLKGKEIVSFSIFKQKAKLVYGDRYYYHENTYKGLTSKLTITCKIHGNFETTPCNFLKSTVGCPSCARNEAGLKMTDDYFSFLEIVNKVHNNQYTYPKSNQLIYINRRSIIEIKCKKHGIFKKKAQKHIAGQGCFRCRIENLVKNNVLVGGYSEELFQNNPELKNRKAYFYVLKINHLYKVGICTTSIQNRIRGIKAKAKSNNDILNIRIITFKEDTLYNCFLLEQQILQENIEQRIFKKWSTELLRKLDYKKYL